MTNPSSYNEPGLLLQVASGDQAAFRQLFDRYWDNIYAVAFAFLKSDTVAEEIVQDIFMKVWLKKEQLPHLENFSNWLFIIARNHIYNTLRKKVSETSFENELLEHLAETSDSAWQSVISRETEKLVDQAVASLPNQQQTIYRLSRIEGLSQEEIADRLQISKNTVKVHMRLALQSIRRYLQDHSAAIILALGATAKEFL